MCEAYNLIFVDHNADREMINFFLSILFSDLNLCSVNSLDNLNLRVLFLTPTGGLSCSYIFSTIEIEGAYLVPYLSFAT